MPVRIIKTGQLSISYQLFCNRMIIKIWHFLFLSKYSQKVLSGVEYERQAITLIKKPVLSEKDTGYETFRTALRQECNILKQLFAHHTAR